MSSTAITVRTPLRLCLGGGSTDLPAYFRAHGGFVLSACIDKWLTVRVEPGNRMCVPRTEQHPYALAAGWSKCDLVTIDSEVPSGSGLGGSSALMVGLLKARHPELSGYELASAAYNLERYAIPGSQCGYQDHYVAAYGGCLALTICRDGRPSVEPFTLPPAFAERLLLMSTGIQRDASAVLEAQVQAVSTRLVNRQAMDFILGLGREIAKDLVDNGGARYGELTHKHWLYKKATCAAVTTPQIDEWYTLAMENGAEGGKVVGAGAGGTMLFVCQPENRSQLVATTTGAGLTELPFKFVNTGVEVVE